MRRLAATFGGRRAALAVAALVTWIAAHPALAATEAGDGFMSLLLPALNLLILLAVIVYFARKPLRSFFGERRASVQEDLQQARELLSEAESRFSRWQRKHVELKAELEKIRGTARERAEAERERIIDEAHKAADRIRRDARTAIALEVARSRDLLREEASQLAIELAARLLEERVTDEDRTRLVEEFIGRIEQPPDSGPVAGPSGAGS